MTKIKRKSDNLLTNGKKEEAIQEIIAFFEKSRDEKIGMIAAEDVLNFFLQNIGENIYNKGVNDSKELVKSRIEDLELELELLQSK